MPQPSTTHSQPAARRARVRESGQSVIEIALSLPIFALLLLGSAELANVAWALVQLTNAARAGVQFGSQSRADAQNSGAITLAATNDAPTLKTMTVSSSQACQCVTATGSPAGTGCATLTECPSPDIVLDNLTVKTTAIVSPLLHYPYLPASFTLHGQATMGVVR